MHSIIVLLASAAAAAWDVTVEERVPPMVSQSDGTSEFFLNCNPAFLKLPDGSPALIVRTQNCSYTDQNKCKSGDWGTLTPSQLVLVKATSNNNTFQYADESRIVFGPANVGPAAAYGTEDPRIIKRQKDGVYFLTFTAAIRPGVKTSYFATTLNPSDPSGWTIQGEIPGAPGGAALLIRDDSVNTTNYIFATDDGLAGALRIGTSSNLYNWTMTDDILIQGRPGMWDAGGVAAGPSPVRLTTGDYLFLYPTDNGKELPITGRCALGWVILDKTDPTTVLARSDSPLMVATTPYEKEGWTANVIFTTGINVLDEKNNEFMIYYGAADKVVAGARIKVHVP
eukprot:TRINITY_DN10442_c0_g1_i1.p1 TRINITY_DN10442_c0_g1~~TRINITY_DN10442_c0_g1_i1.p1  ORF type:complete len:340 (+),score=27.34 TRINITY_DN10442_c0_g1_i1:43-1062(+)